MAKSHRATKMRDHSLYFLLFLMYDGRKPKAQIADIVKIYSFENLQNSLKARNTRVFVVSFSSADGQLDIGDRKLESWTLGFVEDCRFLKFFMNFTISYCFVLKMLYSDNGLACFS